EARASQCKAPSINAKRAVGIARTAGTRDGERAASIVRYGSSSRIYEQAVGGVCTGDRNRVGAARVDVGSQVGGWNSIPPIGCGRPISTGAIDPVIKCVDGEISGGTARSGIAIILAPGAARDADRGVVDQSV